MVKNVTSLKPELVKDGFAHKEIKLSLLTAAVSATLRMIVPTFGLFLIGLTIDFALKQTAMYAIVGAVLGLLVAAFLIYLQIKQLKTKSQDSLVNDHGGIAGSKTVKQQIKEKR
ncbi:hypothetical protein FWC31_02530 [Candidatus Saccharibacteria bacterium]|nr:hypothetical protein [Candidatus Saccharibacteria bacterium]